MCLLDPLHGKSVNDENEDDEPRNGQKIRLTLFDSFQKLAKQLVNRHQQITAYQELESGRDTVS